MARAGARALAVAVTVIVMVAVAVSNKAGKGHPRYTPGGPVAGNLRRLRQPRAFVSVRHPTTAMDGPPRAHPGMARRYIARSLRGLQCFPRRARQKAGVYACARPWWGRYWGLRCWCCWRRTWVLGMVHPRAAWVVGRAHPWGARLLGRVQRARERCQRLRL